MTHKQISTQLIKFGTWWQEECSWRAGIPVRALVYLPDLPLGLSKGREYRACGLQEHMPEFVLAVPRGGYGSLWLSIKTTAATIRWAAPLVEAAEDLRRAGNCVVLAHTLRDAKDAVQAYINGEFVRALVDPPEREAVEHVYADV